MWCICVPVLCRVRLESLFIWRLFVYRNLNCSESFRRQRRWNTGAWFLNRKEVRDLRRRCDGKWIPFSENHLEQLFWKFLSRNRSLKPFRETILENSFEGVRKPVLEQIEIALFLVKIKDLYRLYQISSDINGPQQTSEKVFRRPLQTSTVFMIQFSCSGFNF